MDKKKQMQFNLNNFLMATSQALDFVKSEVSNTSSNHSKKVAYLALKIAKAYEMSDEELSDIVSYSLVHSLALIEYKEFSNEYYNRCNELCQELPFLIPQDNIIKYQNEFYNGSGSFGLKDNNIPIFSQILSFSIKLDTLFDLSDKNIDNRIAIVKYVNENKNILFDENICNIFLEESKQINFWLELQNESDILYGIFSNLQDFSKPMDFEDILAITSIYTELFDGDIQILELCHEMCYFYKLEHKDIFTLLIAVSLKNIGKFMIRKELLEKTEALSRNEYEEIKAYPFYTKKILNNIMGFSDISQWASKIQERIDRSGYPFGLLSKDLSFKDRVLITISIYDALLRKKTYRAPLSHAQAIEEMKKIRGLDFTIIEDINRVFTR